MPMSPMADQKLRAWWAHRQGLAGGLAGRSAMEVLERAGWARPVGGAAPCLTLFARAGSIAALRRNAQTLMTEEDHAQHFRQSKNALMDMPDHGIPDRGRLIGFWQFDPAAGRIVATTFIPANKQLQVAIDLTEAFIREDLEDFRSFSPDSPKSRIPRIEALRTGRSA